MPGVSVLMYSKGKVRYTGRVFGGKNEYVPHLYKNNVIEWNRKRKQEE
jgi:hypothetical protein